jgi:hypothetical protein
VDDSAQNDHSLDVAVDALEEAEEALEKLPWTREVLELQRRCHALRTVLRGVAIEQVPTVTEAQESKVIESAVCLAREVAEVRGRRG